MTRFIPCLPLGWPPLHWIMFQHHLCVCLLWSFPLLTCSNFYFPCLVYWSVAQNKHMASAVIAAYFLYHHYKPSQPICFPKAVLISTMIIVHIFLPLQAIWWFQVNYLHTAQAKQVPMGPDDWNGLSITSFKHLPSIYLYEVVVIPVARACANKYYLINDWKAYCWILKLD